MIDLNLSELELQFEVFHLVVLIVKKLLPQLVALLRVVLVAEEHLFVDELLDGLQGQLHALGPRKHIDNVLEDEQVTVLLLSKETVDVGQLVRQERLEQHHQTLRQNKGHQLENFIHGLPHS